MAIDANSETLLRLLIVILPAAVFLVLLVLLTKKSGKRKVAVAARDEALPVQLVAIPQPAVEPTVPAAPPIPTEHQISELMSRIAELELGGEAKPTLAPLYLEAARLEKARGNEPARLSALRAAAGFGSLYGPRSAHAEARIELAEDAYAAGDLTSACEHWQMARMAYHDDGNRAAQDRIDKRMRENGCPTDWVLTDF